MHRKRETLLAYCRLLPPNFASGTPDLRYHYCDHEVMADDGPQAKRGASGSGRCSESSHVFSCRRDPPVDQKPAAVSPTRSTSTWARRRASFGIRLISDPDDELAMVFLRHMVKQIVRCVNVVRPGAPCAKPRRSTPRTCLVGVGRVVPAQRSWDFLPSSVDAATPTCCRRPLAIHDGALTLLCISAFTDTATFLETHEHWKVKWL